MYKCAPPGWRAVVCRLVLLSRASRTGISGLAGRGVWPGYHHVRYCVSSPVLSCLVSVPPCPGMCLQQRLLRFSWTLQVAWCTPQCRRSWVGLLLASGMSRQLSWCLQSRPGHILALLDPRVGVGVLSSVWTDAGGACGNNASPGSILLCAPGSGLGWAVKPRFEIL